MRCSVAFYRALACAGVLWSQLGVGCQPRTVDAGVGSRAVHDETWPHPSQASHAPATLAPAVLLTASESVAFANTIGAARASEGAPVAASSAVQPTKHAVRGSAPRRYTVAVVGDSLTDARSGGGGYVRTLRQLCPESQFDNYGIGGQMTNQMRRRFQRDVLGAAKPAYDTVVIFGGVNDLYSNLTAHRTNERIQADLSQMYNWAKDAGLRTVALTVAPWGGLRRYYTEERGENTKALNRWIQSQVGGLVETALDTGPLLSCDNPAELCAAHLAPFNDGIHFGKAAHEILGRALHAAAFAPCR